MNPNRPAEIIVGNRHPPRNLRTWADRIGDDEIARVDGVPVTTPARSALDIACRYPRDPAVAAIDALAHATDLKLADVELLAARYAGRRGIVRARATLDLVDPGAESPRETWLRLILVDAGLPRPQTQIPVFDEYLQLVARVDMGWEDMKVAVEYDGDHHRTDRRQFVRDVERLNLLTELGWTVVRVTSQDCPPGIIRQVTVARDRRL